MKQFLSAPPKEENHLGKQKFIILEHQLRMFLYKSSSFLRPAVSIKD